MNYERLFSFAVFAEHLSFTHAARRLGVSQPALHVQVKKLAADVGVPLYTRRGKALALTPAGERVAVFAREVHARGDALVTELRGKADDGTVTLATGAFVFVRLLAPAVRKLGRGPTRLRLLTANAESAAQAVREARADLAVIGARAAPRDLEAVRLRTVGQHVIVPEGHGLARRAKVRPRDLAGERLVVPPPPSAHRDAVERLLAGTPWEIGAEVHGWDAMLALAGLGVGLTIVNDLCPPPRGMVAVPLEGAAPITYFMLTREPLRPSARRFADLVAALCRADAPLAPRDRAGRRDVAAPG
jgi:DNA-binding transcriptional LysR family regulator